MSLENTINIEIKTAMLSKNEATLRALRAIKSAIIIAKTAEGKQGILTEDDELKILQKLSKQRKDSLEIYINQNREDLAQKEKEELEVIAEYLPKQLSTDELNNIIAEIIKSTNANTSADLGKVIGIASKQLAGKADGKTIASIVKNLLSN